MTENLPVLVAEEAETALSTDVLEVHAARKAYQVEALSPGTRKTYGNAVRQFAAWCDQHGREKLPASIETIADWAVALANGTDGGKPRAKKTVGSYVSAIVSMHRLGGYDIDTKNAELALTMRGINRLKARSEIPKKAAPLLDREVNRMLLEMNPARAADARDGALLAVGWAGALRRSELTGLDWQELGMGSGFVRVDERGVEVVLMVSKASQEAAVSIAIPAADMPAASKWLLDWIALAGIQPGEPVFRPVDRIQRVFPQRLHDGAVSEIVKKRVRDFAIANGKSKDEIAALMRSFSGHSMRSGFVTSAVDKGVELARLAPHTRHKSLEVLQGYVRNKDQWKKSPLRGLGF